MFYLSRGEKHTLKHVATGVYIHNITQSKDLVHFLHELSDSIMYVNVCHINTSLEKQSIQSYLENGTVIPGNKEPGRFTQCTSQETILIF